MTMTNVVGYVRVSTEEQANEGVSLDAQRAKIDAYCTMRGLALIEIVEDAGVSAGKALNARKGGERVLELVKSGTVAHVVSMKLDRLFRDCADCLTVTRNWDKADVSLHLVDLGGQAVDTSTAMGRFFLTVMAGAAEMERNLIAERTSFVMQHMRAQGKYTGGKPPFGYALNADGELVENPDEQEIISTARELRRTGLSLRKVAAELAEAGKLSRAGRPFTAKSVRAMVKS